MIVIIPGGNNWGLGPSLLYMFGMLGALVYVSWPIKRKKKMRDEVEDAKAAIFHDALMRAAGKKIWPPNLSCACARAAHNDRSTPTPLGDSTCAHGIHKLNACGACIPPRGSQGDKS